MNNKCKYFPEEGPICYAGSDISGEFKCTKQYSLTCIYAERISPYEEAKQKVLEAHNIDLRKIDRGLLYGDE